MYFRVDAVKGNPTTFTWWLFGDNHKQAGWAGETFPSRGNAHRAATSFRTGAASARFEVYLDKGIEYRWRAWRSSDKVAASGEAFYDKSTAQRAADNVRDNAQYATGL
jgi:uncharacterized protein YegP (UPF0339 family)